MSSVQPPLIHHHLIKLRISNLQLNQDGFGSVVEVSNADGVQRLLAAEPFAHVMVGAIRRVMRGGDMVDYVDPSKQPLSPQPHFRQQS